jgi:two-component SAPR family response regulator
MGGEMSVIWEAVSGDHGVAANDEFCIQPRILVLQRELITNLPLAASITNAGYDFVGPFNTVSRAFSWIESNRPDAAILDINLRDGVSFDLAAELLRRKIPLLFYTSWDNTEHIPTELRDLPFLEKPAHLVLVARLLSKLLKDGQVLEAHREEDLDFAEDC